MGLTSSSVAAPSTPKQLPTVSPNHPLRLDFDKLFADMEFRAKRAALMNYHEAEKCGKRADFIHTVSVIVGALGVSGIGASLAMTKKVTANSAGVAGMLALPLSGILQFLANGTSSLVPASGEKAHLHVKAGAGWQRIARHTRVCRVQLKYLTDEEVQSPVLSAWYREMVEASEAVSTILPIQPDTYLKFDQHEAVWDRQSKREVLLRKYMDMEVVEQESKCLDEGQECEGDGDGS